MPEPGSAAAGGYLQAVSHGGHLPGGAAFPLAFHRFLLADSGRRGQKGFVNTPNTDSHPKATSCTVSPPYPGDRKPLGRQVLQGHRGRPRSVLAWAEGCPSSTKWLYLLSLHLPALLSPSVHEAAEGEIERYTPQARRDPSIPFTKPYWVPQRQPPGGPGGSPAPTPCSEHLTLWAKSLPRGHVAPRAVVGS